MKKLVNGREHQFTGVEPELRASGELVRIDTGGGCKSAAVIRSGRTVEISYLGCRYVVTDVPAGGQKSDPAFDGKLTAPMPGVIVAVRAQDGDQVEKGVAILVLEAMKTQFSIVAPVTGLIRNLRVKVGSQVKAQDLLGVLEPLADK